MNLNIKGKSIVIAGASRGIGQSIAVCFAEEGGNIAVCARNIDGLKKTATMAQRYGVKTLIKSLDVLDYTKFSLWLRDVEEKFSGIDVFIWNISAQSKDWATNFNLDILGCQRCIDAIIPYLIKSDSAAIIAIGSQAALLSRPRYKSYPAIKAALIHYMSSLSRELTPKGIRVNTVSPSEIEYPGGIWDRIKAETPEKYEQAIARNPLGRFGTPEEVARVVVFLASPAASFVSGSHILVDAASRDHVHF